MADAIIPKNQSSGVDSISSFTDKERADLDNNKSTLEKSQQAATITAIMAAVPTLPIPFLILSNDQFEEKNTSSVQPTSVSKLDVTVFSMRMQEDEMINNVLDSWSKNLSEQLELAKQDQERRDRQGLTTDQLAKNDRENVSSGAINSAASQQAFNVSFEIPKVAMAAAIIMSRKRGKGALPLGSVTNLQGEEGALIFPIEEELQEAMQRGVPESAHDDFFKTASLYINLAQNMAAVETFPKNSEQLQNRGIDRYFSQRYAENMLGIIGSKGFDDDVKKYLSSYKNSLGQKFTEYDKQELATMLKITLLTTALALNYKVEVGGNNASITAEEIKALMLGKMHLPENDIKKELAAEISALLYGKNERGSWLLSPQTAERLLSCLFEYLEKNPKIEELVAPVKVSLGLLNTDVIKQQAPPAPA